MTLLPLNISPLENGDRLTRRVDWFSLKDGDYQPLKPNSNGTLQSLVFPGLWLAVPALLESELAAVLAELQHGLQTSEHQAFIAHLQTLLVKENPDFFTR